MELMIGGTGFKMAPDFQHCKFKLQLSAWLQAARCLSLSPRRQNSKLLAHLAVLVEYKKIYPAKRFVRAA